MKNLESSRHFNGGNIREQADEDMFNQAFSEISVHKARSMPSVVTNTTHACSSSSTTSLGMNSFDGWNDNTEDVLMIGTLFLQLMMDG